MGYTVKPPLLGKDGQPIRLAQQRVEPRDYWVESPNGKYVFYMPLLRRSLT
jgi:hypothetical protein